MAAPPTIHLPAIFTSPRQEPPKKTVSARRDRVVAPPPLRAGFTLENVSSSLLNNPPLSLSDIRQRANNRGGAMGSLSARVRPQVVEKPSAATVASSARGYGIAQDGHVYPLDTLQKRSLLWGEFQFGVAHLRDAPEPTSPPAPRPPPKRSTRGAGRRNHEAAQPADWPTRVAQKIYQAIQKSHEKVKSAFDRFDTDGSGALDATEFDAALRELKIFESLDVPASEQGRVLFEVFDAFDEDGNGVMEYAELKRQLRPGKHGELKLPKKLQAGAAPIRVGAQQTHQVRKKEEWKALERFDTLLDADGDGVVTSQEALSLLLAEGYDVQTVHKLMKTLDTDANGVIDREEWRKGVATLPQTLLSALTDPVAPPTGEEFADLACPTNVERAPSYARVRGSASMVTIDERVAIGKSAKGCTIAEPTQRAMRLPQLRSMLAHIARRVTAERWIGTTNNVLDMKGVTLFDVLCYVIKPATRARKCSFVELVADGPQPPMFFASHWWGGGVTDFGACLEQHALDRKLDPNEASYWSSAYALCQWGGADARNEPTASNLLSAMHAATGGVLTVVDRDGACFARTWILYESAAAVDLRRKVDGFKWDVYTAHTHRLHGELVVYRDASKPSIFHAGAGKSGAKDEPDGGFFMGRAPPGPPPEETVFYLAHDRLAVGLTDGLLEGERDTLCKAGREGHFPAKLILAALKVDVQSSETSSPHDHTRLLNALAGNADLEARARRSHPSYEVCNCAISGGVAVASLVRAMSEGGKMLRAALEALKVAPNLRSIALPSEADFTSSPSRASYEALLDAMPVASIESLSMALPRSVRTVSMGKLGKLQALTHLDMSGSYGLEVLPDDIGTLHDLVTLELARCERLITVPSHIFDLPRLTTLNLAGCVGLRTLSAFGALPSSLTTLILQGCTAFADLAEHAGAKLAGLAMLNLDGCAALEQVPHWVVDLERGGNAVIRPEALR